MKGVTSAAFILLAFERFQSTLPMKGVTLTIIQQRRIIFVSIHTPNEGSDSRGEGPCAGRAMFQSTLPMKGVTPIFFHERLKIMFQSTLPMKGVTAKSGKKINLPARYGHFTSIVNLKINK